MPHVHAGAVQWWSSLWLIAGFVLVIFVYLCGWRRLRSRSRNAIPAWGAGSFIVGLSLIWIALGSRLAVLDHELLTAHMIQHLLLMTVGPPLIWLGEPVKSLAHGMPRALVRAVEALVRSQRVRRLARTVADPSSCWLAATAALVGWHVPAALTLAMQSPAWHEVEHASFLAAGLLFWWPVVRPWPSAPAGAQWSIVLYLFFATLPCDLLSAFLIFSDRIAYSIFLSVPHTFAFSALDDQQCAGALMWTAVTIVYLVAGTVITARLLVEQPSCEHAVLE